MTIAAISQPERPPRTQSWSGAPSWVDPLSWGAVLIASLVIFDSPSFFGYVHADSLQLALETWDLSTHDYAWQGMQFSRVPSLFPDLAIFGSAQLLTGSWRFAFLVFGISTLLGLAIAAGWIVDRLARCGWRLGTRAFLTVALPLLFLELPVTVASRRLEVFVPNGHGGPLALAFAALCVACAQMERGTLRRSIVLAALTAAGTISDPLFLLSFTAPVLGVAAYRWRRGTLLRASATAVIAAVLAGVAVGRVLDLFLNREGVPPIEWLGVPAHVRDFILSPGVLAGAAPVTVLLGFGLPLALFLLYPRLRRDRAQPAETAHPSGLWWTLAATSLALVAVQTAVYYEDTSQYRYTMPLQWWPVVFASALLVQRLAGKARWAISAGLGGLSSGLAVFYLWPGPHAPAILRLHHPLEACLLEGQRTAGLKAGLADYWHARYLKASSDWRLQIEQIESDGAGSYFDGDRFWSTHDMTADAASPRPPGEPQASPRPPGEPQASPRPPVYNYIVMADLDEGAIRRHFGAPDRTLACGGTAVWIYDDTAAFRSALVQSSPPLYATFLESGEGIDRICIAADRFFSAARSSEADRRAPWTGPIEARAETPNGWVPRIWGPYFTLPAGRWRIALDYSLATDAPGRDSWQITAGWPDTYYEGSLPPTGGELRTVEAEVDLAAPAERVEIRSYLAGRGGIAVSGASITRVGAGIDPAPCPGDGAASSDSAAN